MGAGNAAGGAGGEEISDEAESGDGGDGGEGAEGEGAEGEGEGMGIGQGMDIERELALALKTGFGWAGEGGQGDGEGGRGDVEWDLRFTSEFKEELFQLKRQPMLLRSTIVNLHRLARGETGRTIMKQLKGTPKNIPIFESPCKSFKDGPRFLWQYAVDYSPRIKSFCESIRLWRICLQHDDVPKGMDYIIASHKRGRTSTVNNNIYFMIFS